jgi:hypothetical protein
VGSATQTAPPGLPRVACILCCEMPRCLEMSCSEMSC